MKHILIVDDVHAVFMEILQNHEFVCDFQPDISVERALEIFGDYDALVVRSKFKLTRDILEKAGKLRIICRAGAGMDNIDMLAAAEFNIHCINAPEGNRDAVGEHTLGLLLALSNKLIQSDRQVKKQIWNREANRGIEIKGKTIAIIGFGNTGAAFARKLQGFECRILAYDKYKSGFGSDYVEEAMLEEVFDQANILSLHIPLTFETKGMMNGEFISRFKKPFYFLNTSRGEVQRMTDLVLALNSGQIIGAGLDVLENEKFPLKDPADDDWFQALSVRDNVVLTPHTAGWTVESYFKISTVLAEKILKFYNLSI